ncbi:MAG: hypothetical protein LBE24_01405 [Methylobacillus sp.]|jgi:hypothetical protein|nr:hypothetical protein [Methylobacillus sp.]
MNKMLDTKKYDSVYAEAEQARLAIQKDVADKIYRAAAQIRTTNFIAGIKKQRRFSPEEEQDLNQLAADLKLGLSFDDETRHQLEKYKLFWRIENTGELPVEACDIALQAGEICHYTTDIDWYEQRKVPKVLAYQGVTGRIKIAKGLYYRLGALQPMSISEDVWQQIDSGCLYITNKRIIFMGVSGNKVIDYKQILSFQPYADGIEIDKETGKSPIWKVENDADALAMIFGTLFLQKLMLVNEDAANNYVASMRGQSDQPLPS